MTEIINTNFVHDCERREATIPEDAPYTLFEPSAEGRNRNEILDDVKEWAKQIGVEAPYTVPLGGSGVHSVGEVLDDQGVKFLEEVSRRVLPPDAMLGVLKTIAHVAEQSGFDRDNARFMGSFLFNDPDKDPNQNIHSDGLSGAVREDTVSIKTVRFVYALGPGTIIYPKIDEVGYPIQIDYDAPTNAVPRENPSELDLVNSARGAEFTDDELMAGDAQQVVPGVVLGFDPTRTLWHQAHDEPRPILVVDVQEVV